MCGKNTLKYNLRKVHKYDVKMVYTIYLNTRYVYICSVIKLKKYILLD